MKLKLLTNIGKLDNEKLGLDKTIEGDTVNVPDPKIANFLLEKGWAAHPDADGPETTPSRASAAGDRPPTDSVPNDAAAKEKGKGK